MITISRYFFLELLPFAHRRLAQSLTDDDVLGILAGNPVPERVAGRASAARSPIIVRVVATSVSLVIAILAGRRER